MGTQASREGVEKWRQEGRTPEAEGAGTGGLGHQTQDSGLGLCAGGQLTSIRSIRMGSASWIVMASGVTRILSGGGGKSHSLCFFSSPHTHVRKAKTDSSQANLGSSQALASHWQSDPRHIA